MNATSWVRSLAIILSIVFLTQSVWPQASTSNVRGTVRDQSNAVLPGAAVALTNTATNVAAHTTTNEAGLYVFPGIVPGPYRLTIESPGMQKFEGALTVQVAQDAVVEAVLKIGDVTAEVSVKDVTPTLIVDSPTLGHVLERQRIDVLPINGRYVQSLLQTVPGLEGTRAYGVQVGSLEWVQDGGVYTSRFEDFVARPPGLDTIEEFKVETNSSSAKYTRPTTVILSTKSGTNQLHGAAFETARNNGLGVARARTDFYDKPPHLVRNEFGASVGGPVVLPKLYNGRNRTFWFFAWEDYRNISSTTDSFVVPTQAMRNGDFRGLVDAQGRQIKIYDPLTTNSSTWARQQFAYQGQLNVIDPSRMGPLAKFLFSITPLPTRPEVNPMLADNWFGPVPTPQSQRTITTRIDQRFSDKDQFYGRYTKGSSYQKTPNAMPLLDPNINNFSSVGPNQTLALHHVHIFNPTLFNELVVSGHRDLRGSNYDRNNRWLDDLGLPNPRNLVGFPALGAWNTSYLFQAWVRNGSALNNILIDDNVTKMHGRHEFQFGFHFRYNQLNITPNVNPLNTAWGSLGTSLFDSASSRNNPLAAPQTGDNLANMYLGLLNYTSNVVRGYYYERANEYALYFQDNFKIKPRLTLNLGLRWDMWPAPRDKNGILSGYDIQKHAVIVGADLDKMNQLGYTLPSIVNRLQTLGAKFETYKDAGLPRSLIYNNWKNFGPHLGFAYRGGEGKSSFVLRGGYSISYFTILLNTWTQTLENQPPFNASFAYNPNNAALSPDGIANYGLRSVPTVFAGVSSRNVIDLNNASSIAPGANGVPFFDPNQPDAHVQNWNLTLEKEVLRDTVARVAYVGNHGAKLNQFYTFNENPSDYIWFATTGRALPTGTLANVARRPYDQQVFGTYQQYTKSGWSNFNGMQFELERRYHRNYGFQLFYLVGNALGTNSNAVPGYNQFLPGTAPEDYDQRNRLVNYQRDTTVPKHRLRWNWIADLPVGKGKLLGRNAGGFLNKVIGDWQIAGIGNLRSTYFALPSGMYPNGNDVQIYGYKYPIQDCRGGSCVPGYLWWNGYIPPNQLNTHNAAGKCTGICGVPDGYKPAAAPLVPYGTTALPANAPAGTNVSSFWDTNTVWVPLKDGTVQRTTFAPGMTPWQNQYAPSVRQWGLDASLFKTIVLKERLRLRFNADFFNVLNHPGNPAGVGAAGILSTQASGQPARQLQLSLRLTW